MKSREVRCQQIMLSTHIILIKRSSSKKRAYYKGDEGIWEKEQPSQQDGYVSLHDAGYYCNGGRFVGGRWSTLMVRGGWIVLQLSIVNTG